MLEGLNIGAHQEAAEHFLSALAMQQNTGGTSEQLWFTLRRVFSAMVCGFHLHIVLSTDTRLAGEARPLRAG
jgi:hypothetical protein